MPSEWHPTMRLSAGGISRDFYHTPHSLHASTTLSPSPPGVCERLAALSQAYPCAACHGRSHNVYADIHRRRRGARSIRTDTAPHNSPRSYSFMQRLALLLFCLPRTLNEGEDLLFHRLEIAEMVPEHSRICVSNR